MAMKEGTKMFAFGGILLFVVLVGTGQINLPFLSAAGIGPDGVTSVTEVKVTTDKACGSTTMTMDFTEKYSASTDMTAQNGTVYINGNEKGVFSEGGTFTAQGGDELNVYYALNDLGNSYYASHASGEIECTGQTAAFGTAAILGKGSLSGALQTPADQLYASSTALSAATVYNKKTLVDLSTTALAISAGGTETARAYLDWTFEEGVGVADGNTLACRFTDSQIDQDQMIASLDGAALGTAKYIPSLTRFSLSAANQSAKYWAFPAIDGAVTASSTLDIAIKGDDDNQPDGSTNMSCEVLDTDLFKTDLGTVDVGIEDSDNQANVGRSTELVINIPLS